VANVAVTTLDRERADPGQNVPAVLLVGDGRLVHSELKEEVVKVGVVSWRRRDDRHLGGQRMSTAEPVDLQRVTAAHDPHQQRIPLARIAGQVRGEKIQALRCTTAHHHAPDAPGGRWLYHCASWQACRTRRQQLPSRR
jgi:hypothetical protein